MLEVLPGLEGSLWYPNVHCFCSALSIQETKLNSAEFFLPCALCGQENVKK